jgi:hypothetical protein
LPANSGLWPNVIRLVRTDAGPIPAGGSFDMTLHQQSGARPAVRESREKPLHMYPVFSLRKSQWY